MTFDEFKKTCYHTRTLLRIPLCNTSINKGERLMTNGKYDFDKEEEELKFLYEYYKLKDK